MTGSLLETLGVLLIVLVFIALFVGAIYLISTVVESKTNIKSLFSNRIQIYSDLRMLEQQIRQLQDSVKKLEEKLPPQKRSQ